ncbi:MAG: hypothetical protein A2286_12750 [Gammaproteobacteria bacterium RIFOXYA12_FULL_61_12]|nr:MAG: hypothetical protein A2286_12750 [Gammaproteobacteria bacterium RIFOXYA12_FULL_61_12]
MLALEPRILLDAAAVMTVMDQCDAGNGDPGHAPMPDPGHDNSGGAQFIDALTAGDAGLAQPAPSGGHDLLFVDAGVAEEPAVQQALAAQRAANPELRVLRLEDGDRQLIRDTLGAYEAAGVEVDSVYILSRNAAGGFEVSPAVEASPETPLFDRANVASNQAAVLDAATMRVQESLTQWAGSGDFPALAAIPFSANAGAPEWTANAQALQQSILDGDYSIRLEVLSSTQIQGALGAYSATGTAGQPTIYLNGDWLADARPCCWKNWATTSTSDSTAGWTAPATRATPLLPRFFMAMPT